MRFISLLLLLLSGLVAMGQVELKGKVTAAGSGSAVPAASVFLSNTSFGTVTNQEGEFTLQVPAGKYDLVVSSIGYETYIGNINTASATAPLAIVMQAKPAKLDDVVIAAFEKDGWAKWGKFFMDNFVGTSEFAEDCTIENTDVIRFRNDKKTKVLTATAMEPLVVKNTALGYKLVYDLQLFEYNFATGNLLYLGYPLFTPMEGNPRQQRRWEARRAEAYQGSLMHFMRSVYRNRLTEEGFNVRRLVKEPNLEKQRVKRIMRRTVDLGGGWVIINEAKSFGRDSTTYYHSVLEQPDEKVDLKPAILVGDSIAYALDSFTAALDFPNYLHVHYTRKDPPAEYIKVSPQNNRIMSEMQLINNRIIEVQSNGVFSPVTELLSSGYWAWSEKLATMLPYDYKPPPQGK